MRRASVSKADLSRVREFLREMGERVASVDVEPARVSIKTVSGLTLDPTRGLDKQVPDWKLRNGNARP